MDKELSPKKGQIVKVLRGRDAGKYAVVIGLVDEKFVLVADGDKRKFDQPKKKNIQHLELQDTISGEVVRSLEESNRVTNGKLRHALAKFLESQPSEADEKGE